MAHKKAGGSAKNLRDSKPKFLGVKLGNGAEARLGSVIIRQRGTKFVPGDNVGIGKDHTIFALKEGLVNFKDVRKRKFDGSVVVRKRVSVG